MSRVADCKSRFVEHPQPVNPHVRGRVGTLAPAWSPEPGDLIDANGNDRGVARAIALGRARADVRGCRPQN
jgi:hypothetical protein